MKRLLIYLSLLVFPLTLWAQAPTGEAILRNIDKNMVIEQAVSRSKMIIHGRTGSRSITSKAWIKGNDKAFVEYLSPARIKFGPIPRNLTTGLLPFQGICYVNR